MSPGSLAFRITDLRRQPVVGQITIDLSPHESSRGGAPLVATFDGGGKVGFTLADVACHDGLGTLYTVRVKAAGYKPYAFLQHIKATRNNLPSEPQVRLMINPKRVTGITRPPYRDLPAAVRRGLDNAAMVALDGEDESLVGKQGAALYDALGPLGQACLLNLVAKATHPSAERIARFVRVPTVLRQDRCFAEVDPAMRTLLCKADRFVSASSLLHEPPKGFTRLESFKSKDAHANIQVTFMQKAGTDQMWADIDIDEAGGIQHGFEVIRNIVVDGRTNPYLIRDLLLGAEFDTPIDPGYDFVLR